LSIRAVCAVPHPPFTPSPLMRHPCTAAKDDTPNADSRRRRHGRRPLRSLSQVPIPRTPFCSLFLFLSRHSPPPPPSAPLHTDVPFCSCLCVLLSTESTADDSSVFAHFSLFSFCVAVFVVLLIDL
jgi:hypothetical protein